MAKKIGELLKEKGYVTDEMFTVAYAQQRITGQLIGEALQQLGFVTSIEMAKVLSEQTGIPYINIRDIDIPKEILQLITRDVAESLECLPIGKENGRLNVGVVNPANVLSIDRITKLTGMPVNMLIVDSDSFKEAVERVYYFLENPILSMLEETIGHMVKTVGADPNLISKLTELILQDGVRREATDIHITPESNAMHVFYRVDGVLQYGHCIPKASQAGITSKIKIMASIDIAEQRLPQDGFFNYTFLRKKYDIRVSTIPTIFGENIVLRLLSGSGTLFRFDSLGYEKDEVNKLEKVFHKPFGILLVTGPTGSGKTTTLYAALRQLKLLEKNVITVEDPVEYRLSFVRQTQVNTKSGYNFTLAARNFMRQDPDVMLIGEIRDEETASIAIRASITGHLVLSTLHTNDAVGAIPRLLDLGVEKYNVTAVLVGVIAQRLVRKICPACKAKYELTDSDNKYLADIGYTIKASNIYYGKGCELCFDTGFLGRLAVGEVLVLDDELKELINEGASVIKIKHVAVEKGMRTMLENALIKLEAGVTSLHEIQRVLG
ncbi:MAG: Flp pilus assembly complex ATPase component TadA [Candidatus Magnetominusculus sp. LBB02]|nr:Flp pilus assembly complex ATPase component TadA [Candidatus Magnetominusculus sp. LBB02]MCG6553143.1 Flp pilus assembly complex ATPase component TadA [Candidatus Magnetominusculus sp. LBB02]